MKLKIKLLLIFVLSIWMFGIFSAIFLPADQIYLLPFIKKIYSGVCHQQELKLFSISGKPLMVCARCFGIYAGGFISSFILLFINKKINLKIKYLIFSSFPLILDVIFSSTGVYGYSKIISFLSGLLFGSVTLFYIYIGYIEFFIENKFKRITV